MSFCRRITETYLLRIDTLLCIFIPGYFLQFLDCGSDHEALPGMALGEGFFLWSHLLIQVHRLTSHRPATTDDPAMIPALNMPSPQFGRFPIVLQEPSTESNPWENHPHPERPLIDSLCVYERRSETALQFSFAPRRASAKEAAYQIASWYRRLVGAEQAKFMVHMLVQHCGYPCDGEMMQNLLKILFRENGHFLSLAEVLKEYLLGE